MEQYKLHYDDFFFIIRPAIWNEGETCYYNRQYGWRACLYLRVPEEQNDMILVNRDASEKDPEYWFCVFNKIVESNGRKEEEP